MQLQSAIYHTQITHNQMAFLVPYLLLGATQVQWPRREGTLQARETDF